MSRQARRLHGTFAANETTDFALPSETETEATTAFEGLLRCRLALTEHQRHLAGAPAPPGQVQ